MRGSSECMGHAWECQTQSRGMRGSSLCMGHERIEIEHAGGERMQHEGMDYMCSAGQGKARDPSLAPYHFQAPPKGMRMWVEHFQQHGLGGCSQRPGEMALVGGDVCVRGWERGGGGAAHRVLQHRPLARLLAQRGLLLGLAITICSRIACGSSSGGWWWALHAAAAASKRMHATSRKQSSSAGLTSLLPRALCRRFAAHGHAYALRHSPCTAAPRVAYRAAPRHKDRVDPKRTGSTDRNIRPQVAE